MIAFHFRILLLCYLLKMTFAADTFLTSLQWRRAVKHFASRSGKQLTAPNISKVLEAIRLAPSSYGLMPYKVHVITKQATKDKIVEAAYNQPQVLSSLAAICIKLIQIILIFIDN
jgi:nitroreductase